MEVFHGRCYEYGSSKTWHSEWNTGFSKIRSYIPQHNLSWVFGICRGLQNWQLFEECFHCWKQICFRQAISICLEIAFFWLGAKSKRYGGWKSRWLPNSLDFAITTTTYAPMYCIGGRSLSSRLNEVVFKNLTFRMKNCFFEKILGFWPFLNNIYRGPQNRRMFDQRFHCWKQISFRKFISIGLETACCHWVLNPNDMADEKVIGCTLTLTLYWWKVTFN